jgi:hypothetical protein
VSHADKEAFLRAADDVDSAVFEISELASQLETIMGRIRDFGTYADDDLADDN